MPWYWLELSVFSLVMFIVLLCLFVANKTKVYYGLLKGPDISIPLEDEEEQTEEGGDKPKVRAYPFSLYHLFRHIKIDTFQLLKEKEKNML